MIHVGLNHMTVARASFADLLRMASDLGCVGVETRNDLAAPLFDGRAPEEARTMLADHGVRLLAVAEVTRFDALTGANAATARDLIATASRAGAEGVALIPCNDRTPSDHAALVDALSLLRPMLEDAGLTGLVEPLGFASASLRTKTDALAAIEEVGGPFRLVHDTFHHHLAAEARTAPDMTGLVHVSGVTASVPPAQMTDAHRGLVDAHDRLDTVGQITRLIAAGYTGAISMEAFAPKVHALADPLPALRRSFDFIRAEVTAHAA